jgi:hypothetical protein
MRVVCVLRSGGRYNFTWVRRLAAGLKRHNPDAELYCLTDAVAEQATAEDGTELVPLRRSDPGWWAKQELWAPWQPWNQAEDLTLYVDLDSVITGVIAPLFDYPGCLAMMRDFMLAEHREVRGKPAIGSAVVLWRGDAMQPVWEAFTADPAAAIQEHQKRSDHFIRKHLPPCDYVQDLWPGLVVSAKSGFREWRSSPPSGGSILCGWGRPRMEELPENHWFRTLWEGQC